MCNNSKQNCPYEECYLPDNNVKYIIQFVYLIASGLFLIKKSEEFTFFSVFLFIAPILLDLVYTRFRGKLYTTINWFYIIINASIALFCFAGMFGFFVDGGEFFAVSGEAMVCAGKMFKKKCLLIPMTIDLLVPVMMHRACPSKKTKEMVEFGREHRKAGS